MNNWHFQRSVALTDVHRKVQALPIKEPKKDDVAMLISVRNCSSTYIASCSWGSEIVSQLLASVSWAEAHS